MSAAWMGLVLGCELIARALQAEVGRARAQPIVLAEASESCRSDTLDGGADLERGRVGGRAAIGRLEGPQGSGRWWQVTLAVELRGGARGACLTAVTSGWRNIEPFHRDFGKWSLLGDDRVTVWTTIEVDDPSPPLLAALVYRLDGVRLVLDLRATLREVARFGRAYGRAAADPDDSAREAHRAAAEAYAAVAERKACPPAGKRR
jgi:hypothetical protein